MKKVLFVFIVIILTLILKFYISNMNNNQATPESFIQNESYENNVINNDDTPKIEYARIILKIDKDNDGINDLDDIVQGALKDAKNKPIYKSSYYSGGYPPDDEGVCTDVIWRAFKNAGYNLKEMIDKDIRKNIEDYPGIGGSPDPNIDFRRVKNLYVYFKKYSQSITTEIIPYNASNLEEWQGGDIVIFDNPEHIAVISTKRRNDGIPYIIHNAGPYTREADDLLDWLPEITGHFRYPKQ